MESAYGNPAPAIEIERLGRGLSWRITKQVDARDPSGGATGLAGTLANGEACAGLNQERVFTFDASWRAIAEEVNDDFGAGKDGGVDRWVQQFVGVRGLNDVVMRRESRGHPFIPDDPSTTEEDEIRAGDRAE